MTNNKIQGYEKALAKIAIGAGLGIQEGNLLLIRGEPPQRGFMLAAAAEAYLAGARYVRFECYDERLNRIRADSSRPGYLDTVPESIERSFVGMAEEGWSLLVVEGPEVPGSQEGADMARLDAIRRAAALAFKPYLDRLMANAFPWCILPCPTEAWARHVLGDADAGVEELWDILAPILHLDAANPTAAVLAGAAALDARAKRLQSLGLKAIHFEGPGSDLSVSLSPSSRWIGGGDIAADGRRFLPNIPSEEIFTSPDFKGVEGRVACTRRTEVIGGVKVEGAWLEFRGGEVTAGGARTNADSLEKFLATDAGTRRLGEVALVDCGSPLWRSGREFGSILLDENAACHIALGFAFPGAFAGAESMGPEEKAGVGYNESLLHVDFMIGSDKMDVTGLDASGEEIALIRGGRFVI